MCISRLLNMVVFLTIIIAIAYACPLSGQTMQYESIITLKFQSDASNSDIQQIINDFDLVELRSTKSGFIDFQMPSGADPVNMAERLASDSVVTGV